MSYPEVTTNPGALSDAQAQQAIRNEYGEDMPITQEAVDTYKESYAILQACRDLPPGEPHRLNIQGLNLTVTVTKAEDGSIDFDEQEISKALDPYLPEQLQAMQPSQKIQAFSTKIPQGSILCLSQYMEDSEKEDYQLAESIVASIYTGDEKKEEAKKQVWEVLSACLPQDQAQAFLNQVELRLYHPTSVVVHMLARLMQAHKRQSQDSNSQTHE